MTRVVVAAGGAATAAPGYELQDKEICASGSRGDGGLVLLVVVAVDAAGAATAATGAVGQATYGAGDTDSDRAGDHDSSDEGRERSSARPMAALRPGHGPRRPPIRRTAAGQRDRRRRPRQLTAVSTGACPVTRRLHGRPVQLSGVFSFLFLQKKRFDRLRTRPGRT